MTGCSDVDPAADAATSPTVFDVASSANPTTDLVDGEAMTHGQLRLTLQLLLGEHTLLTHAVMTVIATGASDADVAGAISALTTNTAGLTDAIALAYGATAAEAFAQIWNQHAQFFADYAAGRAADDPHAVHEAHGSLEDYRDDFASFLDTATGGDAPLELVRELLDVHVRQMEDALTTGPDGGESRALAEAHAHMYVIGGALADAIATQQPDRFPGPLPDDIEAAGARQEAAALRIDQLVSDRDAAMTGLDVDDPAVRARLVAEIERARERVVHRCTPRSRVPRAATAPGVSGSPAQLGVCPRCAQTRS